MSDTLFSRVVAIAPGLPETLRRTAEFFVQQPSIVATESSKAMGAQIGVSDASVIRTAKALGYEKMRDLRRAAMELVSTRSDPSALLTERINQGDAERMFKTVIDDAAWAVGNLMSHIDAGDWETLASRVADAHWVLVYGLTPVGYIAEYLAYLLRRVSIRAYGETRTGVLLADRLTELSEDDVVIVFAPIHQFGEIPTVIREANRVGALSVLVTEAVNMPIRSEADIVITTPQAASRTAGEAIAPVVLSQALYLDVARRDIGRSKRALAKLNRLRREVVSEQREPPSVRRPHRGPSNGEKQKPGPNTSG